MIAAKVLRIVFIHGRCFRTCYVLKLLTTMNAGTRTHEKRARTRPSVRKIPAVRNYCVIHSRDKDSNLVTR